MQAYQQRVIEEKTELDAKLASLSKFLATQQFSNLDGENQKLLLKQEFAMGEYSYILSCRIKLFK